jgi:ferredoxin/flavodoxin---NADP+ reductase
MSWLQGKVIENRAWTDALFSIRLSGVDLKFEAGQFVRLALDIEGERVARPFSFVNPPQDPVLEFYGIVVPEGPLSPRLAGLRAGDTMYVASNPAGFLVLSEVPDAQTLWLLSTGTGIAPFLSILRTEAPWKRFREIVLVHAVRRASSLAGRIPQAISDGRLEAAAGVALSAQGSQVMLCGNPDMLKDAGAALAARGMRKHRRRAPGHITSESFW